MRSNIIEELLSEITPERKTEIDKKIEEQRKFHEWLKENNYVYGTPTSHSLILMREYGLNPIGICTYMCEETFIFKTKKEAEAGFKLFERELNIVNGWWYSKKSFSKVVAEEKDHKPANVYWL